MTQSGAIGFIGIGNMGWPMAANLVKAGFAVTVHDANAETARRFADEHGATAAGRLADMAGASLVVTMLPTGREVREVLLGEGGVAIHLQPGSIAVDMSSADPVGTRETGALLARSGIGFVDAPVSGGVPRATDGTLAIMIGGEAGDIARARPALAAMGDRLFEVGTLGCGHALKALNNFLAATSFAAASEAVAVGRRFGLDPAVMMEVVNVSTGRSFASDLLIRQHVLNGAFGTGFALGLLAKDVGIAADLARDMDATAPIVALMRERWDEARDAVGGSADHTRAAPYWETGTAD